MTRQNRTLLVLALAIGLAGLASFGVYRLVKNAPVREVEVATSYVVVAAHPLPMGAQLNRDVIKLAAWPKANPVSGSFSSLDQVLNRGLIASVVENEPITETKLAAAGAGAGLPPTIPPGMRAMSVKVNEVISVAGFVVPGTRVDVTVTLSKQQESMSRIVVSNVQVLTAGTRFDQEKAKDGKPIPTTVVTLLVTPEDAERIALAMVEGQIVLALRNPLDTQPTQTPGVRLANLMGPAAPVPVMKTSGTKKVMAVTQAPPPVPSVYKVEAIRAAKRTEETLR
ncbi:MAG: Flp pilus assembly protein CpaB [Acidimicrobiia bacterium]